MYISQKIDGKQVGVSDIVYTKSLWDWLRLCTKYRNLYRVHSDTDFHKQS